MLGQLDVLHQLDHRIQVEQRGQRRVQLAGAHKIALGRQAQQIDRGLGNGVGHARHPGGHAQRSAFQNQVVHPAHYRQAIAETGDQIGYAGRVVGLFLDGDDGRRFQQFGHHVRRQVDAELAEDVAHDLRRRRRFVDDQVHSAEPRVVVMVVDVQKRLRLAHRGERVAVEVAAVEEDHGALVEVLGSV